VSFLNASYFTQLILVNIACFKWFYLLDRFFLTFQYQTVGHRCTFICPHSTEEDFHMRKRIIEVSTDYKILIVDDEEGIINSMKVMLTRSGYFAWAFPILWRQ